MRRTLLLCVLRIEFVLLRIHNTTIASIHFALQHEADQYLFNYYPLLHLFQNYKMWDPFRDVDRFLSGLNNTIGNAGGNYGLLGGRNKWHVAANVAEDDRSYTVEVDVPGMKQEEVRVEVEDRQNRVCISGTRATPSYLEYLQRPGKTTTSSRRRGGEEADRSKNEGGGGFFSNFESSSTVTSVDEKGNITTTRTTNSNGEEKTETTVTPAAPRSGPRPILVERDFGPFERCFNFPERILRDTASAEMADGVLVLTIDKAEPSTGSVNVPVRGRQ